jgi:pseudaminic acid cytidylyltransferase
MNIAIIPARGGSKRIPRKNIKLFHGLPVIAYAIKAAKESEIFEEVFVSTDDEEIADIAISFGASVPWMRPKELSDDYATTVSVMQDAVNKLKLNLDNLENVCCIYPATPLLKPIFLSNGLEILENGGWNYVFAGVRSHRPPQRFFSLGTSQGVEMLFSEFEMTRTQDLAHFYHDAGQFYWGRKSSWECGLPIFSSQSTILQIPSDSAVDIDSPEDWHYAEGLFGLINGE